MPIFFLLLASALTTHLQDVAPASFGVTLSYEAFGTDAGSLARKTDGLLLFAAARYHRGDDPTWAMPDFDDASWEIAGIGLREGEYPASGWPGVGWFRVPVHVDASLDVESIGFMVQHAGAVELYLDGIPVFRSGRVASEAGEERGKLSQDPVSLPLAAGADHVLAIRYSNFVSLGHRSRWFYAGPGVYWGNREAMVAGRATVRFNQGFFSAFFLAFGLLFFLLYALYRSERLFLLLAVSQGLVAPFVYLGAQASFVDSPALVMPLIVSAMAFAIGGLVAELTLIYAFFRDRLPRQLWVFAASGIVLIVLLAIRLENLVWLTAFVLLIGLEMLRVIFLAVRRRRSWAWIVAIGVIPGIFIQTLDQFEQIGLLSLPWSDAAFDPGIISMLCFSGAFAVYVGLRFSTAQAGLAEVEAARRLQQSMLPRTLPEVPGLEIAAFMRPASRVGGDYYDFHVGNGRTLTVAVGDATGHGTEAGMMVTATKSLWSAFLTERDLLGILERTGEAIKRMGMPRLYMALALVRVDEDLVEAVGAGLPPALLVRAGSEVVEQIALKGIPLGGPSGPPHRRSETRLDRGDTLLLMTDGFPERFNASGEMFGYDRAEDTFGQLAELPADALIQAMVEASDTWGRGRTQDDDMTFVVIRRTG